MQKNKLLKLIFFSACLLLTYKVDAMENQEEESVKIKSVPNPEVDNVSAGTEAVGSNMSAFSSDPGLAVKVFDNQVDFKKLLSAVEKTETEVRKSNAPQLQKKVISQNNTAVISDKSNVISDASTAVGSNMSNFSSDPGLAVKVFGNQVDDKRNTNAIEETKEEEVINGNALQLQKKVISQNSTAVISNVPTLAKKAHQLTKNAALQLPVKIGFYRNNPTEDSSGAFTHQLKSKPALNKFDSFKYNNLKSDSLKHGDFTLYDDFKLFYNFFYLLDDNEYISFEKIKSHPEFLNYNNCLIENLKKIRSKVESLKKGEGQARIKEKSEAAIQEMSTGLPIRHLYISSLSNKAMIILSPAAVSINDYGVWLNDGWEVERAMDYLKDISTKLGYKRLFPEKYEKIMARRPVGSQKWKVVLKDFKVKDFEERREDN